MLYTAVNPKLISETMYNLALPDLRMNKTRDLIQKYVPKLKNLKQILIAVDHSTFFLDRNQNEGQNRHYNQQFDLNSNRSISELFALTSYPPKILMNDLKEVLFSVDTKLIHEDDQGFVGDYRPQTQDFARNAQNNLLSRHNLMDLQYLDQNLLLLNEIISITKSHQIDVVFISLPVYPDFYQFRNENYVSIFEQTIKQIISNCNHCSYVDYSSHPGFSDSELYLDAVHLNEIGAEKFSLYLKKSFNTSTFSFSQ
jgi:hypothetical protein